MQAYIQASSGTPPCSQKTLHIAGISTTVHGLEELPANCESVSCIWLLHGRLGSMKHMDIPAAQFINGWNKTLENSSGGNKKGLIAVSFDQRNHGSRQLESLPNETWKTGNPRHAQDVGYDL